MMATACPISGPCSTVNRTRVRSSLSRGVPHLRMGSCWVGVGLLVVVCWWWGEVGWGGGLLGQPPNPPNPLPPAHQYSKKALTSSFGM
jgi:hypothetical protein